MDCIDLFKKAAAAMQTDPPVTWNWMQPAAKTITTRSCRA